MPDPWLRSTQTLRYCDADPMGHINNAVYATMFEAGRVELLDATGLIDRQGRYGPVLVRLEIDFRLEMTYPGSVTIETAVARLGAKSVHVQQRVLMGGVVCAEGVSVLAVLDKTTRRAIPLDDKWRQGFAPWMLPGQ